jgi:type II secretory pathway component PulF
MAVTNSSSRLSDFRRRWLKASAFGDAARTEFLATLAGLVDTGIPVYDALIEMRRVMRRENNSRHEILGDIIAGMDRGMALGLAMKPWLADHETMMLGAVQRGVSLNDALSHAANLTRARNAIIGSIAGALGYPIVLIKIGVAMLAVFGGFVIPILAGIVPEDGWTGIGALFRDLSSLVVNHGIAIGFCAVLTLVAAIGSLPRWQPDAVRTWLDHRIPPWNLYRAYASSILLISIATQIRAGIPISDAIDGLYSTSENAWLRDHLNGIRKRLREGGGVRLAALIRPIFSSDVRIALSLYDRFSDADTAMIMLGTQAADSAQKTASRIGKTLNAAVLLFTGLLLAGFVLAVFSVVGGFFARVTAGGKI